MGRLPELGKTVPSIFFSFVFLFFLSSGKKWRLETAKNAARPLFALLT